MFNLNCFLRVDYEVVTDWNLVLAYDVFIIAMSEVFVKLKKKLTILNLLICKFGRNHV
jgi:hypothetical protein